MKRFNFLFAVTAALLLYPAITVIYGVPKGADRGAQGVQQAHRALVRPVSPVRNADASIRSAEPFAPSGPIIWEEKEINGVKYYIMPLDARR